MTFPVCLLRVTVLRMIVFFDPCLDTFALLSWGCCLDKTLFCSQLFIASIFLPFPHFVPLTLSFYLIYLLLLDSFLL